jgi:4-hydroxy-tetrahydrodipicolinate reductase
MTSIGLFGASGRMGSAIAEAAADRDDVSIVDEQCDVLVDFSAPDALEAHLEAAVEQGKPIVIATSATRR